MVSSSADTLRPGTGTVSAGDSPRRRRRLVALRSALVIALLGAASVAPFYLAIYHLQSAGRSAAALGMADMHMERMSIFWSFPLLQASGIAALIWAYLGVFLGLLVSAKPGSWWPLSKAQTDRLHRQISLLVIGLILVHAVATAYDAMGDNLATVFIPGLEPWTDAVFAYNLGIIALYLAVLVGPTYYLRRRIGTVRWRFVHRAAVVVYLLSVWHTLLLGMDFSYYGWVRPVTWLAQIPLLVLFAIRLGSPVRQPRRRTAATLAWLTTVRSGLIVISGVAVVAIVALVATGHANLPIRVDADGAEAARLRVDWLPTGLGMAATAMFGVIALAHIWHLAGGDARWRCWHAGHVVMALGMIDMFLPATAMPVPASVGVVVFAVGALAAAGVAVADRLRGRQTGALWLALAVDFASMVYMFAMPARSVAWLSLLLVVWLVVQATGWASGQLVGVIGLGGLGGRDRDHVSVEDTAGSALSASHGWWLRITLAAMAIGMVYMFVAMQLGALGAMGGMSSMTGM